MGAGPKVRCAGCNDVVQSLHRHDYRRCTCGATAIDGGDAYTKIVWDDRRVAFPEAVEECG